MMTAAATATTRGTTATTSVGTATMTAAATAVVTMMFAATVTADTKTAGVMVEEDMAAEVVAGLPVCRDFQFGRCSRGTACRFEHVGSGGGGGSYRDEPPRGGPPNNGACFDFLKGRCFRRDCKFIHDDAAQIEVSGDRFGTCILPNNAEALGCMPGSGQGRFATSRRSRAEMQAIAR